MDTPEQEHQLAVYDPHGGGPEREAGEGGGVRYERHRDGFPSAGLSEEGEGEGAMWRRVTAILYCNSPSWPEADGGCLRMYSTGGASSGGGSGGGDEKKRPQASEAAETVDGAQGEAAAAQEERQVRLLAGTGARTEPGCAVHALPCKIHTLSVGHQILMLREPASIRVRKR